MAAENQTEPSAAHEPGRDADSADRWLYALVGAVVTVVTAFVPFSPVLGGGVAGYLDEGTDRDGLRIGALAGGIASLPILAIFGLVFLVVGVGMAVSGEVAGPLLVVAIVGVVVAFVVAYTVVLSAVGGLVGAAIAESRRDRSAGTPSADDR